jgi:hypothetical protein
VLGQPMQMLTQHDAETEVAWSVPVLAERDTGWGWWLFVSLARPTRTPEWEVSAWSVLVLAERGTPETKMDRHPRWSFAPRTRTQGRSHF